MTNTTDPAETVRPSDYCCASCPDGDHLYDCPVRINAMADLIESQAAQITGHESFLAEARRLSDKIEELSLPGMRGNRALMVNRLTNDLHELIELGEADPEALAARPEGDTP